MKPTRNFTLFSWFFLTCALLHARAEAPLGMITGDRVNLRNEAGLDSDVIGQVNYGDEVEVLEVQGEWIRIRPPAHIPVWVHGGLLFEEREVRARVLNVRNGPGTQFTSFGQLQRGDAVRVLEQVEEWRRIAAPESVSLWVSREFVQVPELPAAEVVEDVEDDVEPDVVVVEVTEADEPAALVPDTEVEKELEEALEEAVTDLPADEPAESIMEEGDLAPVEEIVDHVTEEDVELPSDLPLVPLPGQGTASMRRGWVKAYLIAGSSPSRFHLVHRQGNQEQTLAYLQGDEEQLRQLSGRNVQVRGRDFWVAGQRVPVMRIESIEALETPGR